jgi:pilus assembly protein CpaE
VTSNGSTSFSGAAPVLGLSVLIADEDLDSRVNLRRSAERAGLTVVGEAGYGTEAVSLALDARPDVILIGVEEPAARALDTADAVANVLPETPLVIYSSQSDADALRRSMVVGARDYLVKPVSADALALAVSGVLNQEERRQMRNAGQLSDVSGRGTVITVAGAKGGVGKSVLSANLSVALRRETSRTVAVIDADTHFGDIATLLDVTPTHTVSDVIGMRDRLDRTNIRELATKHNSGVDVVAASEDEGAWDSCTVEDVKRIVDAYAAVYDFVVIDTSGALDRFVRSCIDAATLSLIVSSGDVSSVRDTVAGARRLANWGVPSDRVRYVMNTIGNGRSISPDAFAEALGHELFWVVPYDTDIVDSVQTGQPVVDQGNRSRGGESLTDLARLLAGRTGPSLQRESGSPLWRRMWSRKGTVNHDADMDTAIEAPSLS